MKMPLQLEAAPPEAYIWVILGRFWAPGLHGFARRDIGVGAVSGQFVVPLERRPPPVESWARTRGRLWRQKVI